MLETYNAATGQLLDKDSLSNLAAGAESDVLQLEVWWNKGDDDDSVAQNVLLLLHTLDKSGAFSRVGSPPQDELWFRYRVTGQITTGHPAQELVLLDWRPLGAFLAVELGDIHADCARLVELKAHPPAGAQQTSYTWQLVPWYKLHAIPAPAHVADLSRGVLTGVGDRSRSGLLRGGLVTVSDPADDQVHVAAALYLLRGEHRGLVASSHQLDQTDSAAAALQAGESYLAVLTLGDGAVTVTKGTKDAAPVAPTPPAGEPVLRTVQVHHDAGGTSVLEDADLQGELLYDRLRVEAVAGDLSLRAHPGRSLAGGTHRLHLERATRQVSLNPNVTSYHWQTAAGLDEVTETATPPEDTALLLARATTDATEVTELVDRRTYAGRTQVLRLQGQTGAAAGVVASLLVEEPELHVEVAAYRLGAAGGGSAGQHVLSYDVNGATAYPGSGTDDQRGLIAWDATELVHRTGIPEVLVLRQGDLLELRVDEVPTGAADVLAELTLTCRRP